MVQKVTTDVIDDGDITTAKIADGALSADATGRGKMADGFINAAKLGTDAVESAKIKDLNVTAGKLAATLDLSGKTLTLPAANTPAFTKSFTSSNQTITAAGTLSLAHGLGVMPSLVQVRLKCTSAEGNFSVGDEVIFNSGDQNAHRGCAIVPDATNLVIRYGSDANTFNVNNKTTGASFAITNASWVAIFKAWA